MKEIRTANLEAESAQDAMTLAGWPIVFDTPTSISDPEGRTYTEVIARGALEGADLRDSTLIYNHDENRVPLARTPGTMTFKVTERGLHMVASLAGDNQTAREVYSAVKRGDLSGMSFAFTVPEGGSLYDPVTNTRTITRISKVYEVSVVPFPAYPTTSVEARGAMRAADDDEARKRVIIKANIIMLRRLKHD